MFERNIAGVALALALGACASAAQQRSMTYWPESQVFVPRAHAELEVGSKVFSVWFHPTQNAVLIARSSLPSIGVGVAEGLFLGAAVNDGPEPQWRAAATRVVLDLGCAVEDVYRLDSKYWEATYSCPDGRHVTAAEVDGRWPDRLVVAYP